MCKKMSFFPTFFPSFCTFLKIMVFPHGKQMSKKNKKSIFGFLIKEKSGFLTILAWDLALRPSTDPKNFPTHFSFEAVVGGWFRTPSPCPEPPPPTPARLWGYPHLSGLLWSPPMRARSTGTRTHKDHTPTPKHTPTPAHPPTHVCPMCTMELDTNR